MKRNHAEIKKQLTQVLSDGNFVVLIGDAAEYTRFCSAISIKLDHIHDDVYLLRKENVDAAAYLLFDRDDKLWLKKVNG
jgi:hypothetical protein